MPSKPPKGQDPRRAVSLATMTDEDVAELLAAAKAYLASRRRAAEDDEAEPDPASRYP